MTRDTGRRPSSTLPVAIALVLASAVILKFVSMPFLWLGWGWTIALFGGSWYLRAGWIRVVAFNTAIFIILLSIGETYATVNQPVHRAYPEGYMLDDDLLGMVPAREHQAHVYASKKGRILYNATYTINRDGLRVAPPVVSHPLGSILFFGCSFTFGEGVEDTETIPYQVGLQSGGEYQIYNFGFHGYGPHQMLTLIETGSVTRVVKATPRYIIYQAIPDHIGRVAGKIPYYKHAARYELDANGTPRLRGHFDDGQRPPS